MSIDLQKRARAFLVKRIPENIGYVPGSIAERFIATFARDGKIDVDEETKELLELTVMESEAMADRTGSPEGTAFFLESAAILREILALG